MNNRTFKMQRVSRITPGLIVGCVNTIRIHKQYIFWQIKECIQISIDTKALRLFASIHLYFKFPGFHLCLHPQLNMLVRIE